MTYPVAMKTHMRTKNIRGLKGLWKGKFFAMIEQGTKLVTIRKFNHTEEAMQFHEFGKGKGGDLRINATSVLSISPEGKVESYVGWAEIDRPDFLLNQGIWCEDGKVRHSSSTYRLRDITAAERKIVSVELL